MGDLKPNQTQYNAKSVRRKVSGPEVSIKIVTLNYWDLTKRVLFELILTINCELDQIIVSIWQMDSLRLRNVKWCDSSTQLRWRGLLPHWEVKLLSAALPMELPREYMCINTKVITSDRGSRAKIDFENHAVSYILFLSPSLSCCFVCVLFPFLYLYLLLTLCGFDLPSHLLCFLFTSKQSTWNHG